MRKDFNSAQETGTHLASTIDKLTAVVTSCTDTHLIHRDQKQITKTKKLQCEFPSVQVYEDKGHICQGPKGA